MLVAFGSGCLTRIRVFKLDLPIQNCRAGTSATPPQPRCPGIRRGSRLVHNGAGSVRMLTPTLPRIVGNTNVGMYQETCWLLPGPYGPGPSGLPLQARIYAADGALYVPQGL